MNDYSFFWMDYNSAIENLTPEEGNKIIEWCNALIAHECQFRTFPYEQEGNKNPRFITGPQDLFTVGWENAGVYLAVLKYKGEIVSVARLTYGVDDYATELILTFVMTNPDYRKQGHARELMERIKEGAKVRNFTFLSLCYDGRNHDAVEFYRKTGWITGQVNAGKFIQ